MINGEEGNKSVMDVKNFTKNNQLIHTLDIICEPNIMTLAQAVLEIFRSQGYLL